MKTFEQITADAKQASADFAVAAAISRASGAALVKAQKDGAPAAEIADLGTIYHFDSEKTLAAYDLSIRLHSMSMSAPDEPLGVGVLHAAPRHVFIEGIAMHGMSTDEAYAEFMSQGGTIKSFTSFGTSHHEFRTDQE